MDNFKKASAKLVGIGGIKCPCCNIFIDDRKSGLSKFSRRKLKQELHKEISIQDSEELKFHIDILDNY